MKKAVFKMFYLIAITLMLAGVRYYINFEIAVLFGFAFITSELFFKNK